MEEYEDAECIAQALNARGKPTPLAYVAACCQARWQRLAGTLAASLRLVVLLS